MPSNAVAKALNISRYAALKVLRELVRDSLVERGSTGCPAVISSGENGELVCESRPPINGIRLTSKGRETSVYINEKHSMNSL